MQRTQQHEETITTRQCTSPGTTCSKENFAVCRLPTYLPNRWGMRLIAYMKHRITYTVRQSMNITTSQIKHKDMLSFLNERILVFHAPAPFPKLEMPRIHSLLPKILAVAHTHRYIYMCIYIYIYLFTYQVSVYVTSCVDILACHRLR